MRALDARIHRFTKKLDCRVKPGMTPYPTGPRVKPGHDAGAMVPYMKRKPDSH
jgi:hypothetical protein